MTDLSQKYDFLFRPIKDLTKNWNVDIAAVLEDFHEEIEKMSFSFDDGKTKFNFAEAAMLIQGTACVWSRKVESLYNLVYQTLEMVMSSRHRKQPTSIDNQGVDNDVTFDQHEDKFLNLDDVRSTNLKIKSDDGVDVISISQRCPFLQHSENDRGSPFLTKGGEVTNYYHDFWSNNVVPQTRGIVLLEHRIEDDLSNPANDIAEENQPNQEAIENQENQSLDTPADDFLEDMDDHTDIGDACSTEVVRQENIPEVEKLHHNLRSRNLQASPIHQTLAEVPTPLIVPLDPHCECKEWIPKPFKKQKTIKYPPSLQVNQKKRKTTPPVKSLPLISEFLDTARKCFLGDGGSIEREKKRRNDRWKKLDPNRLAGRRTTNGIEHESVPEDEFAEQVNSDFVDDDGFDVDDLIDDVALGAAGMGHEPQTIPDADNMDTYENLVRHHVDLFYASAKRYVQESALSQRVKEWQESIEPFLIEQEERSEFDIHKYGDEIIGRFKEVGDVNSFKACVEGGDKSEICRHFAAVLQLGNDQILSLSSNSENFQDSINSLKLKLLTHSRPRDRITGYVPH